jgi:hypothetical protein
VYFLSKTDYGKDQNALAMIPNPGAVSSNLAEGNFD